jgi:hypothetical protein
LHNPLSTNYIDRRLSQNQKDIFSNNPHWFTAPNLSSSDSIDDYDEKLRKWILEGTSVLPQKGVDSGCDAEETSDSGSRTEQLSTVDEEVTSVTPEDSGFVENLVGTEWSVLKDSETE